MQKIEKDRFFGFLRKMPDNILHLLFENEAYLELKKKSPLQGHVDEENE
ncbi:hypothetical protein [Proteiniclasticum sp. QWL-01]|nr:hypothetical protein [Proteiniclasticum sp. QWL-01]WFF72963.1 hypothetical protein P6M73_00410 [Proteiniclasticum sp. QWL-01]